MPRNDPGLRKGKFFNNYPVDPIYIDAMNIEVKNIKRDFYKLKTSKNLLMHINKSKINALKEDILKKNIRQRESSPVQIVRSGDRQHPLTSNFSVYDEEDQSPGRVLDKRRNTAQTFGFEIAPGMGKKSQKNSVRFAQTADNFYNRSGVGFTTPDERSAMKQSKIESKFLSTAANTNFNRTTQNSSMGKGNVAVTQNFTLNTKNSTSQKKHKIVTKGGLRFYETDSNASGSPSPQRGTPQGQVQSIEYSPSRSENSHSSQRSTSQILRS